MKELRSEALEWEVCKGKDHQSEDDGYKLEGIDLDSDETNTHGELNGDMHCVYEHKGLEYRPRDEEHKSHQPVYIQTSNPGMQKVFAPSATS